MTIIDQIKQQFKTGSDLTRIIYINLGLFVFMLLVKIVGNFVSGPENNWQGFAAQWLAMPSGLLTFLTRPWTIFTYMFLHLDFFHLFWNMILLYFTGTMFIEYLGGKRFVTAYIGGGLAGAILYFIIYNISNVFEGQSMLIGASAGVWGVVAALTFYVPNLPVRLFFVLQVKLWHVAIFMFIGDLLSLSRFENPGGMLAHFGGALFGYFLVTQLRKGKDWSNTGYAYANALGGLFKKKTHLKTVHKSSTRKTQTTSGNDQKRLDEILDKIKVSGYDNLSKNEKEFLFKFGKK